MDRPRRAGGWRAVALLGAIAIAVMALGACGSNDPQPGSPTDRAFLEAMIPHHRSAIAMARVAKNRAHHPQITELADTIIGAQAREVRQIKRIHRRLFNEPILPNADAHQTLGLTAMQAGMAHGAPTALKAARPFDKAFIDEMVSHHQGAVRMALAVIDKTADGELGALARAIITTQSNEIEAMNQWRKAWYGAPSPAGGIPGEDAGLKDDGSMSEHEGH